MRRRECLSDVSILRSFLETVAGRRGARTALRTLITLCRLKSTAVVAPLIEVNAKPGAFVYRRTPAVYFVEWTRHT